MPPTDGLSSLHLFRDCGLENSSEFVMPSTIKNQRISLLPRTREPRITRSRPPHACSHVLNLPLPRVVEALKAHNIPFK